jgi:hypothetical protein
MLIAWLTCIHVTHLTEKNSMHIISTAAPYIHGVDAWHVSDFNDPTLAKSDSLLKIDLALSILIHVATSFRSMPTCSIKANARQASTHVCMGKRGHSLHRIFFRFNMAIHTSSHVGRYIYQSVRHGTFILPIDLLACWLQHRSVNKFKKKHRSVNSSAMLFFLGWLIDTLLDAPVSVQLFTRHLTFIIKAFCMAKPNWICKYATHS